MDDEELQRLNEAIVLFNNSLNAGQKEPLYAKSGEASPRLPAFQAFFKKYTLAWDFYKSSGFTIPSIPGHLRGIDFNYPVTITPLPPPGQLQQMQSANSKYQGTYYAEIGTPPDTLGIAAGGSQFNPKTNSLTDKSLIKTPNIYTVAIPPPANKENNYADTRVKVLKSTAAPIVDTWSYKDNRPINTPGGGTQYCCAESSRFTRQDTPIQNFTIPLKTALASLKQADPNNNPTPAPTSKGFKLN